jgi:hypothetical protein
VAQALESVNKSRSTQRPQRKEKVPVVVPGKGDANQLRHVHVQGHEPVARDLEVLKYVVVAGKASGVILVLVD